MTKSRKNSIQVFTENSEKHLSNILSDSDLKIFKNLIPELQDSWKKKQMFRTETEMRFSVLNDGRYPTKAAKYWQSVREQNSHFENTIRLSFDYRKNNVEIRQLKKAIAKEKDEDIKELKQIELEAKQYNKLGMELQAKHRIREVSTWSKIKKELNDKSFDDKDVNTHQQDSYLKSLTNNRNALNEHSSHIDVFNTMSQLTTLRRIKEEKLIKHNKKKAIKK